MQKSSTKSFQDFDKETIECKYPDKHSAICKDLINYSSSTEQNGEYIALYRNLYETLNGAIIRGANNPILIKKMKGKYKLRRRELYLNGTQTQCKHFCLYNKIKKFFVPSKLEIKTIFALTYKPGLNYEELKKKLITMELFNMASGTLYKILYENEIIENMSVLGKRPIENDIEPNEKRAKTSDISKMKSDNNKGCLKIEFNDQPNISSCVKIEENSEMKSSIDRKSVV